MRSLLWKCLAISTVLILLETTYAQELSDLMSAEGLGLEDIRTAQFEDVMEAIPSASTEGSLEGAMPDSSSQSLGDPVMQPEMESVLPGPPMSADGTMPMAESVLTETYGQPYDIPLGDVIPGEDPEIYSTNNWFRGGRWYSKQEFMMMLRTDTPLVHIGVDSSSGTSDPFVSSAFSTKDADFRYEAGTRLTLGKILGRDNANRDHSVEFIFTGLFDYTGRAQLQEANEIETGPFGIRTLLGTREANSITGLGFPLVNDVPGFTFSERQEILYQSDFNSFEMNYMIGARPARDRMVMQPDGRWVRHATPSKVKGFYTGFRYIRQNESFRYTGIGGRNRFVDATGLSPQERIDEQGRLSS